MLAGRARPHAGPAAARAGPGSWRPAAPGLALPGQRQGLLETSLRFLHARGWGRLPGAMLRQQECSPKPIDLGVHTQSAGMHEVQGYSQDPQRRTRCWREMDSNLWYRGQKPWISAPFRALRGIGGALTRYSSGLPPFSAKKTAWPMRPEDFKADVAANP